MFKRTAMLTALVISINSLSACMYYANFDRQRADTEQVRQRTALIEAHAACIKLNAADPVKCPKPTY